MSRVNISIPDDLREAMAGLNCNWSALAKEAFSHAVELEQLKSEGNDMQAGLVRLRGDKKRHSERERTEGIQKGQSWALGTASYDELKDVAGNVELANHPHLAVEWVNHHLDSNGFDLPGMPKNSVGEAYALGFIEGASVVFNKV